MGIGIPLQRRNIGGLQFVQSTPWKNLCVLMPPRPRRPLVEQSRLFGMGSAMTRVFDTKTYECTKLRVVSAIWISSGKTRVCHIRILL